MNKILGLFKQHREVILYLIFGGLTTAVNVAAYVLFARVFNFNTTISTVAAWLFSVLFAYLTNRKWVFESQAKGFSDISREIISFFSCRLLTGVVDWLIMLAFVDGLKFNDVLIKILANVIVIILNYIASKLVIFAKKEAK